MIIEVQSKFEIRQTVFVVYYGYTTSDMTLSKYLIESVKIESINFNVKQYPITDDPSYDIVYVGYNECKYLEKWVNGTEKEALKMCDILNKEK